MVDGFDEKQSFTRCYLSSIEDPDDLTQTGIYNLFICPEPDITSSEIYMWNSLATDDYSIGEYVMEDYAMYVVNVAGNSQPSLNSDVGGDYSVVPSFCSSESDGVLLETDNPWVLMERTTIPPADFDSVVNYYEHTFVPTISPSEEFDNFTIKIEMYADNPVQVPTVRRLRAIATE